MLHSKDYQRSYDLLKEIGAQFVRLAKRSELWQLPDKRMFSIPIGSGDFRSPDKNYADLKRMLAVKTVELHGDMVEVHERRVKKKTHVTLKYVAPVEHVKVPDFRTKVRAALGIKSPEEIRMDELKQRFGKRFLDHTPPEAWSESLSDQVFKEVNEIRESKGLAPVQRKLPGHRVIGGSHTRHGPVRIVPPDVLVEANRRLALYGEHAMQDFLRRWREGQITDLRLQPKPQIKEKGKDDMATIKELLDEIDTKTSTLRQFIADAELAKDMLKKLEDAKAGLGIAFDALKNAGPALVEADFAIDQLSQGAKLLNTMKGKGATTTTSANGRAPRKQIVFTPKGVAWPAVKEVLTMHGPLRIADIHKHMIQKAGFEHYSGGAVYQQIRTHADEVYDDAEGRIHLKSQALHPDAQADVDDSVADHEE